MLQEPLGLFRLPLAPRPHPLGPSLSSACATTHPLSPLLRPVGCCGRAVALLSRLVPLCEAQLEHLHHRVDRVSPRQAQAAYKGGLVGCTALGDEPPLALLCTLRVLLALRAAAPAPRRGKCEGRVCEALPHREEAALQLPHTLLRDGAQDFRQARQLGTRDTQPEGGEVEHILPRHEDVILHHHRDAPHHDRRLDVPPPVAGEDGTKGRVAQLLHEQARVLIGDEKPLGLTTAEEAVRLLPDAKRVVLLPYRVQHLPAKVEEPAVPPLDDRRVARRVPPILPLERGGRAEHRELGEDGHEDVLGRVEAPMRGVHLGDEVGPPPLVLGHRGGRVARVQLVPPPRSEQDRVAQLDRGDASALVVRECEDVVSAAAAGPVGEVRLDPLERAAVELVAQHGRRQPRVTHEERVGGGGPEEARDVAATVDRDEEEVGRLGVERAVARGEQQLVHRQLHAEGVRLPNGLVPLAVPPVGAVVTLEARLHQLRVEGGGQLVHVHRRPERRRCARARVQRLWLPVEPPAGAAGAGGAEGGQWQWRGWRGRDERDRAVGAGPAGFAEAEARAALAAARALVEAEGEQRQLAHAAAAAVVTTAARKPQLASPHASAVARRAVAPRECPLLFGARTGHGRVPQLLKPLLAHSLLEPEWRVVGRRPDLPRLHDLEARPARRPPADQLTDAFHLARLHVPPRVDRPVAAHAAVQGLVALGRAAREHARPLHARWLLPERARRRHARLRLPRHAPLPVVVAALGDRQLARVAAVA